MMMLCMQFYYFQKINEKGHFFKMGLYANREQGKNKWLCRENYSISYEQSGHFDEINLRQVCFTY